MRKEVSGGFEFICLLTERFYKLPKLRIVFDTA
jgi:hypothetical protein